MSKNELINATNISKPTKNNKKNIFKSKIEEIQEIFHDPIIDRDEQIEEIKKNSL